MRSRLFICAALAGTFVAGSWSSAAHADPKAKGEKKKASTADSDDKIISKQLQWEDSVMGPDDKRAELDKIARAQAINKAAAEKAAREKEKADAQAAREKEKADAAPKTSKRGGEVALPTLPDEDSGQGNRAKNGKSSEISPKLETATAAAPPPPVKHGDDKFIDKLLKDDGGNKKHKASASEDKALDDLLAVDKPESKGKKGKKDDVDALLSAKPQPMPETHVKHETPEWAKPEISSAPVEAAITVRQQPKKDDGIIHVVQGAATPNGRAIVPAHRTVATPPPARPVPVATRTPAGRRQAGSSGGSWDDPFADRGAPKKTVAARETHRNDSGADDLDDVAPVRRRPPASRGGDAGNASAKTTAGTRRSAPAAKPKWKDPFTENAAPASAAHPTIATREPRQRGSSESTKWDVAERHSSASAAETETTHSRSGRWGVLKKHAH